jgi:general stress protein 26
MLISGITGCGKTYYVLDLLETEFRNKFDYIIIICPTFDYNKTYARKFVSSDPNIYVLAINDQLDIILNKLVDKFKDEKEQTLFIIDDCANLYDAKLKATALTKLAFHGRHLNLSTWVITQKYNAIIKDFRENIKVLVLFYDKDRESREAVFKENDIGLSVSEKETIIQTLKTNKNAKLIMRLFQPFEYVILF